MSDHWLNEAMRQSDANALYGEWVDEHEQEILEAYIESLEFENVPDDFIQNQYEIAQRRED